MCWITSARARGLAFTPTNTQWAVTGQTTVVNNAAYNSEIYDVGYVNTVGASSTNVDMDFQNYSSLVAYSIQESAAPAGTKLLLQLMQY